MGIILQCVVVAYFAGAGVLFIKKRRWLLPYIAAPLALLAAVFLVGYGLNHTPFLKLVRFKSYGMMPTLPADCYVLVSAVKKPLPAGTIVLYRSDKVDPLQVRISRVVAVAGERVSLKGKALYINGAPVKRAAVEGSGSSGAYFKETLGPVSYVIAVNDLASPLDDAPEVTVPDGHYYVLGDFRDVALDSRTLGFLPQAQIEGAYVRHFQF